MNSSRAEALLDKARSRFSLYLDLIRWSKPQGWLLLLWPTLIALWSATRLAKETYPSLHLIFVFVVGTILMRSAGCAINDVVDRDIDRHVERTRNRPVTSGAISEGEALIVAAVLALLAFWLVLGTNGSTIALSFFALVVTIFYPFAKRFVSLPQAVLGLAFSFGIPMAFAAVLGHTMPVAWLMVLANLCWVLAYDTQYAMVDRADDLKIGIRTSAITFGRHDVTAVAVCYALHLLLLAVAAPMIGLRWGFILAWIAAASQSARLVLMIRDRKRKACYQAFKENHWIGATLFGGVVVDSLLAVLLKY